MKLLIVDDTPDVRTMLTDLLTMEGWDVSVASSGEDGIAACADGDFDAVLIDHNMPDLKGIDVAKRIRESGFTGAVMLMSALVTDEMTDAAERLKIGVVSKMDVVEMVRRLKAGTNKE